MMLRLIKKLFGLDKPKPEPEPQAEPSHRELVSILDDLIKKMANCKGMSIRFKRELDADTTTEARKDEIRPQKDELDKEMLELESKIKVMKDKINILEREFKPVGIINFHPNIKKTDPKTDKDK